MSSGANKPYVPEISRETIIDLARLSLLELFRARQGS